MKKLSILSFLAFFPLIGFGQYCSTPLFNCGEGSANLEIFNVTISGGVLSNTTTTVCPNFSTTGVGYSDFTSIVGNITRGTTYTFTVTRNGIADNSNNKIRIWIDFDQNQVFDVSEKIDLNSTSGTSADFTANLTIPNTATLGNTRMRARVLDSESEDDPCTGGYETEDYTLNIQTGCTPPSPPIVSNVTACSGNNVTLTATCTASTPNWYASSTATTALASGSYTIINVATPGTTYYVSCESSTTCVSSRVQQSVNVTETPTAPTAFGKTICSGLTASLSATCATGTAKWYDSNASINVLGSGSFTTPTLTTNTTYFVACESGETPNCVSNRTSQTVTVNANPTAPTASGRTI